MISKTTINKVCVLLLLVISSLLIFYKFTIIPRNLSFDEVEFAKLALSLKNIPYVPYSNLATGHSTLYFYIILLSFTVFGVSNFALRLPAALFGVLNVVLMYFVLQQAFSWIKKSEHVVTQSIIPCILSIVFVTLHWYLNFARFSFEATFLLFLELAALLFLFSYWKRSSEKINLSGQLNIVLAGFFTGLAYLSYTPGRLFFIVPLALLFLGKNSLKTKLQSVVYFIIPFILIILPLTLYLFSHPDLRVNQLSYFHNDQLSLNKKLEYLSSNVTSTAGMFHFKGDLNGRQNYPGKPALNSILGVLFIGGLILSLKELKKPINIVFVLYFIVSLIPTLLTYPQENPHMLRTFTAIPSIVFFIGIAVLFILQLKVNKYIVWSVVLGLLILAIFFELRTYFVYQTQVFPQAFEMKLDLSKIDLQNVNMLKYTDP